MASYSVTVDGVPPRKNRRHVIARGRLINSREFKAFSQALGEAWQAAGHPKIASGIWALEVKSTWPRTRHLDQPVPLGDVDAPLSWIMDALQAAGALDDDARIMSLIASKGSEGPPRVTITMTMLER